MAQIPGVPDISPVEISPRVAGRGGQTIAGMGEDISGMGFEGIALESHIIQAQKSVDQLASHNQLNAEMTKYHDALAKTTNSRDVAEVSKQYQDQINGIAAAWNKSPAASEIQMAADSLRPQIEHFGTVRQVDLMGKEWAAQSTIQIQTLLPQMVAAHRGGRTDEENAIKQHINNIYDDAISKGLITKSDKDMDMNKVETGFRKDLNEAAITSPDQKERTAAINQLKKGGSGPLDLTNLTAADTNALLIKAEEDDKRINSLTEAHNLNGALNTIAEQFQSPEFKNNYEARLNALQDGAWLKKNGIVAEDGSPDRVMAEKLIAETTRQRSEAEKVQQDRDKKIIEPFSAEIDLNHKSIADIDAIPGEDQGGISIQGRSMLKRQWAQHNTLMKQLAAQGRAEARENRMDARQKQEQISSDAMADYFSRIGSGEMIDPLEVRTAAGMSPKDKTQVIEAIQLAKREPDFAAAVSILNDAYPEMKSPKNATPDQATQIEKTNQRNEEGYNQTLSAYNEEMKAHPGMNKQEAMRKVLGPVYQKQITDRLDQMFGSTAPKDSGSWFTRAPGESWSDWFKNRMGTNTPPPSTPPQARIRVRDKKTGQTGTILSSDFNDQAYEKVN